MLKGPLEVSEQSFTGFELLWSWAFRLQHCFNAFTDVEDDLFTDAVHCREFKRTTEVLVDVGPASNLLRREARCLALIAHSSSPPALGFAVEARRAFPRLGASFLAGFRLRTELEAPPCWTFVALLKRRSNPSSMIFCQCSMPR